MARRIDPELREWERERKLMVRQLAKLKKGDLVWVALNPSHSHRQFLALFQGASRNGCVVVLQTKKGAETKTFHQIDEIRRLTTKDVFEMFS